MSEALAKLDDSKRAAPLAQSTEVAMKEVGLVPLRDEVSTWATRAGLRYTGRADQYTLAMELCAGK